MAKAKSKPKPAPKAKAPKAKPPKAKPAPKAKAPKAKPPKAKPLPPLPEGAVERVLVRLVMLGVNDPIEAGDDVIIEPPTLFAVEPRAPVTKRYLYLVQKESDPNEDAIVFMLVVDTQAAAGTRIPAVGVWQRAVVRGRVRVLASDQGLTRAQIAQILSGGHEPAPPPARPPYT